MTTFDPVLQKIRSAVDHLYGERIERIVLYGSRARGDAQPDSDYDIAIFLDDLSSRWQEFCKLADVEIDLLDQTGAVVHAMPYPAGSWQDRASPFMREIRSDGLDL